MHPQWPSPLPLLYQESLSTRSIHSGTPLPLRTGITDFQCTQGLTQWLQPSSESFHHTKILGTTRESKCLEAFLLGLPVLLAAPRGVFSASRANSPFQKQHLLRPHIWERDFS